MDCGLVRVADVIWEAREIVLHVTTERNGDGFAIRVIYRVELVPAFDRVGCEAKQKQQSKENHLGEGLRPGVLR